MCSGMRTSGTSYWRNWPSRRSRPDQEAETDAPAVVRIDGRRTGNGKKSILLIDDNSEIRQYLKHLFAGKYLLFEADNGDAGFNLAAKKISPTWSSAIFR